MVFFQYPHEKNTWLLTRGTSQELCPPLCPGRGVPTTPGNLFRFSVYRTQFLGDKLVSPFPRRFACWKFLIYATTTPVHWPAMRLA